MDHLIIIQAIFPFYKKIKKILKKFLKLLTFCPFQSAISEGVTFLKNIQSLQFKNFPFRCTLKISYPAQIDTR